VADPPSPPPANLPTEQLSALLRGLLLQNLPTSLVEKTTNWGHTKPVVRGVEWKGKGLDVHAELQRKPKNDGVWKKLVVVAEHPEQNLAFSVANFRTPEPGRTTFDVAVGLDVKAFYDQQNWENGRRLFSFGVHARTRIHAVLHCEMTSRIEAKGLIPDMVFRVRVTHADLDYDDLKVEHIAGVGGELAEIWGKMAVGAVKAFRPKLEEELLAKGDAAIIKAADTKEVRVSLSKLLAGEAPTVKRK
jgi:hypothetical protein